MSWVRSFFGWVGVKKRRWRKIVDMKIERWFFFIFFVGLRFLVFFVCIVLVFVCWGVRLCDEFKECLFIFICFVDGLLCDDFILWFWKKNLELNWIILKLLLEKSNVEVLIVFFFFRMSWYWWFNLLFSWERK